MDPEQIKQQDNEPPQPPDDTSFEQQSDMQIPEPTGTPSPSVASAIDQLGEGNEPNQTQDAAFVPLAPPPAKPSPKKLITGIVIGVVVIIAAGLLWYAFFGSAQTSTNSNATQSEQTKTTDTATDETSALTIDKAVDALTVNSSNEASLSGTDDSDAATDAATATANVGDSVNEDNF